MSAVISGNGLGLFDASWADGSPGGRVGQARQYVNIANGNLVLQSQDEQLLFRGLSIAQLRTYNSQGTVGQAGADGWLTGFERRIELLSGTFNAAGSIMRRYTGDGAYQDFAYVAPDTYRSTSGEGAHDALSWDSGSRSWTYVEGSSLRDERYADHADAVLRGRLTRIGDSKSDGASPVGWLVVYDANERIGEIRADDGTAGADALIFGYDANGRLSVVSTRENGVVRGQVEYGYDAQDRLISVVVDLTPQDSAGDHDAWDGVVAANNDGFLFRTTYAYADATSLRIAQMVQSDGTVLSYTYDGSGRIRTVTRGDTNADDSDGAGETATYTYGSGSTTVTDSLGRAWTYAYDTQNRLTTLTAPPVAGQSDVTDYAYDPAGNVTQIRTVRGAQTLAQVDAQYDASGNVLWQRDALGNAVQRSYSATNQLLSETRYTGVDPDGAGAALPTGGLTTQYVYDARDRLRFVIDATGAVTEYQYATGGNGIGQQTSARRYTAAVYAGGATESALVAWRNGQLTNSTLIEYGYDLWGRLASTSAYATVDAGGEGVLDAAADLTRFTYDAQGLLRQQITLRGAARSLAGAVQAGSEVVDYVYDGMGRLLASHAHASEQTVGDDATSVSTTYAYLDSGQQLRVTFDGGRTRTEAHDATGRVITVSESGTIAGATVTRTTRHTYDAAGLLRASENANGARTYFFYDEKGRLQATVDSTGAVTRLTYDGADHVLQTTQYANRVTTVDWFSHGAVTRAAFAEIGVVVDSANDRIQTSTYDNAGRLATQVDAAGTTTTHTYDGADRLLQVRVVDAAQTSATARTTRYFYDSANREIGRLDAEGYLVETAYDAQGRPVAVTRYASLTPSSQWSGGTLDQLRPTSAVGDQVTRYYYDGRGNAVAELDAEGFLTERIFDAAGNARAERRYATAIVWQAGDTLPSLRSRAAGVYRESRTAYNGLGQLVTQTNAEGTVTRYTYDDAGRLVRTEAAYGTSEVREGYLRYNVFDEIIGEIDGEGAERARTLLGGKTLDDPTLSQAQLDQAYSTYGVRHDYDAFGRRIESIDAGGNKTWTFYDAAGRPTFVVRGIADGAGVPNAQGEVTETRYNAFGQATDTFAYTGRITLATPGSRSSAATAIGALTYASATDTRRQYGYTTRGLLESITDAEGVQTRYSYNAFGELSKEQLGFGSSAASTNDLVYDRRGLVISRTEGSGTSVARTLGRTYDAFGRVLTQTDARGTVTTLGYDRIGRQVTTRTVVQGRAELSSIAYDAFGRTLSAIDASGRDTTYVYNDVDRSLRVTTPEGTQVTTTHNRHGDTVTVVERVTGGQSTTRTFVYDESGRLVQTRDGLDHASTQEYDARGLLVATIDGSGRRVELQYDAAGRVLRRIVDPAGLALSTSYTYDGQGRQLTVVDASGRTTAYHYDREGRQLDVVQDPAGLNLRTLYSYDEQDRVVTVTDASGMVTRYAYDALGRRTSETVDYGTGRLNLAVTYVYDANDNLIRRTEAGAATRYYYDEANRLTFTVDPMGAMTRRWYDAAGRLVAIRQFVQPTAAASLTDSTSIASLDARLVWNAVDEGEYRIYDQAGRLRWVLGIDGSAQESLYDLAGQIIATRHYAARFYPDAVLQPKLFAGAAVPGDVVASANDAIDRQSFQVFDAAGRVRYSVDGLGSVREFFYDDGDRQVGTRAYATPITLDATLRAQLRGGTAALATLAAKVDAIDDDARDLRTYTVRDAAGRDRYSVDALGAVTEYLFDSGDRIVGTRRYAAQITVDATLLARLKAGTANTADIAPRLFVDDSRDARTYSVHDAAGRVLLSVDAAGFVRGLSYDSAGRVIAETAFAQPASLGATLRAQLVAGTATPAAVLSVITQDAAVDRAVSYVRDAAGRVRYTLSRETAATLTVRESRYDAAGRVTAEVDFAVRIAAGTSPTVAAVAAAITSAGGDNPGNQRSTQFVYDAAGQLRYSVDALGYVSERLYDGLGRLQEERSYDVQVSLATEAGILAALEAARSTTWSTDLSTLPVAGLNTSRVGTYGASLTHANGQLYFRRAENTTTASPGITGAQYRPVGDNPVFSAELTTGASLANTRFVFVIENNGSGANYRRGGLVLSNGSLFRHVGLGSTNQDANVGSLAVNSTYVIEAHVSEGGVEYFVYLKGSDKTTGFRFSVEEAEQWDNVRLSAWTDAGPGLSGEAVALDNLRESVGASRRTIYRYDAAGNLAAVTDALGKSESYTYDALGQQLTRTDKLNNTWTRAYDAAGRVASETSPTTSVATVDVNGGVTITSRAVITTFAYDALGNLTSRTENAGQADARVTQYVYDNRGHQIRTVFPDAWAINEATGDLQSTGQSSSIDVAYDALGRAVVQKDVRGYYRYNVYDAAGRLAYEVDQEGNVSAYAYNAYGEQIGLTRFAQAMNSGAVPAWSAGQPLTMAQIEAAGVLARADGANRTLNTAYDQLGRKTRVTQSAVSYYKADGNAATGSPVTQFAYDAFGQLAKESVLLQGTAGQADAVWAETWRFYDALGHMIQVVDAQGYVTAQAYNANGELTETIEYARAIETGGIVTGVRPSAPASGDAATGYDRIVRMGYDALGRKTSETVVRHYQRADGSSGVRDVVTGFAYDAGDRVVGMTTEAGTTVTAYDALGRALSVTEPQRAVLSGSAESSLINSTGINLSSGIYTSVSPYTELAYDAFGNLVRTWRYANGIAAGQSAPVADNGRDQIEVTRYDRQGRAVMTVSAEGYRSYTAYDAADHATRSWYTLNGSDSSRDAKIVATFTYDKLGRQIGSSQQRQPTSGAIVVERSESVAYNSFGEIVQKSHADISGTLVYGYDVAGRLVTSNENGATRTFGYNLAGHQLRDSRTAYLNGSQSMQVVTLTFTDKLGRVVAVRQPSYNADTGTFSQTNQRLDRWGNVLQIIDARGYQTDYQYNDFNQIVRDERPLVQAVSETGVSSWLRPVNRWFYDAFGRLVGTRDANGSLRTNVYDPAGQLVQSSNALGQTTRYAYDALGNQRMVENPLGYLTFKEYDRQNRVVSIGDYLPRDAGGARDKAYLQRYALNRNGDRLSVTDALTFVAKYDYDGSGQLIRSQTSMGTVQSYAYDVQGRKVRDGYEVAGSPTLVDDDGQSVRVDEMTWKYDVYGRVTDHNNLSGRDFDYSYDAASGQLYAEGSAGGYAVAVAAGSKSIAYYANGQVREIVENGGLPTFRYEYDAAGNRTMEETYTVDGGGAYVHTITRTWYDSHNRIQRVVQDDLITGKRVFDMQYEYDAVGNRRHVRAVSGYGPNVDAVPTTNTAPVVSQVVADRYVRKGKSAQFRVLFSDVFRDREQDALGLTITQAGGAALPAWLVASIDSSTGEIVFTANPSAGAADQDITVQLNAYETATPSNAVSTTFVVRVRSNTAPQSITSGTTTLRKAKTSQTWLQELAANEWFRDLDVGDRLSLSVDSVGSLPSWLRVDTTNPSVVRLSGTPTTTSSFTLVLRATDEAGASVTKSFQIDTGPNIAPSLVVSSLPVQEAIIGRSFGWERDLAQLFADADGDALQVSASGVPSWMSFDPLIDQAVPRIKLTGQVPEGIPDGTAYSIVLTATDADGAARSITLSVTVRRNRAPVVQMPSGWSAPSLRVTDPLDVTMPISAFFADPEGDQVLVNAIWPAGSTLPEWLNVTVDQSAGTIRFYGTPTTNSQAGTLAFQLRGTDAEGLASVVNASIVVGTDNAPVRNTAVPMGDQTLKIGRPFSFTLPPNLFTDGDGDALYLGAAQVTQYKENIGDNPPIWYYEVLSGPLPSWLTFNPSTRTFSGTVPGGQSTDPIVIRITGFDSRHSNVLSQYEQQRVGSAGNNTDTDFVINIVPFVNSAPTYSAGSLPGRTLVHGGAVDFALPGGAFNEPDGDALTYNAQVQIGSSWVSLSQLGLSIDASTGRITGTAVNLTQASFNARITASDPQGMTANGTFTFGVTNTPPTVSSIPAQSVGRNQAFNFSATPYFQDVNADLLSYSATGLPSGLTLNSNGTFGGSTGVALGNYTVTVSASDGRGGSISTSFTLAVTNTAPTGPASIADQTATAGTSWGYTIPVFSDPNGDTLTYVVSGMPGWMTFDPNPATRRLAGVPGPVGSWTITVVVTDSYGASISRTVTVTTPNAVPYVAAPIPAQTSGRNMAWSYTLPAGTFADANGDSLTYSATGLPSGITFDPATRVFSGSPSAALGNYTVTVTASDGRGGSVTNTFTLSVVNYAPNYGGNLPLRTANQNQSVSWTLPGGAFTDPNLDALTYQLWVELPAREEVYWNPQDQAWDTRQRPAEWVTSFAAGTNLSINSTNGAITGTAALLQGSGFVFDRYRVKIVAADPSGLTAEGIFTFDINVPASAPAVSAQNIRERTPWSFVVPVGNDNDGDPLSYSVSGLPAGLGFNAGNRTISGTPTQVGTFTVTVTVSDGSNPPSSTTFQLTVRANNLPAPPPSLPNSSGQTGSAWSYTVGQFTDADGDALTYGASGMPPGVWFDPGSRTFGGTPTAGGSYTIYVSASDGLDTTTRSFVLSVSVPPPANQPPYLAIALQDQFATTGVNFGYTFPADAFRDPNGDLLTYTAKLSNGAALPSWLSFAGRTFSGKPTGLTSMSFNIVVTAKDPAGLTTTGSFVLYKEGNALVAGPDPEAMVYSFDMGQSIAPEEDSLSAAAGVIGVQALAAAIPVQTTDSWFTYDAENRVRVSNGELVGGQIRLKSGDQESFELVYDVAGREVTRFMAYANNTVTYAYRTTYDLRGHKTLEFHPDKIGGGPTTTGGVQTRYYYDASGRLLEARSYFDKNEIRSLGVDREGEPRGNLAIGGWLNAAELYSYDQDGRLVTQTSKVRTTTNWAALADDIEEGTGLNQYSNLAVLNDRSWTSYTRADGSSGYDALGRGAVYRYSGTNIGWAVHTYTTQYEGWEGYQEKSVTGISNNTNYKTTTNTLTYDTQGRLLTQREHTNYANVDDRVRYYSQTAEGRVQTRRAGTINSSNQFVQDPGADGNRDNVLYVHAAGQQMAELREGGQVRYASGYVYNTPQLASLNGTGNYEAGGGKVIVQAGDTLSSVAQRVYGNSSLWYVLADANGLNSPDAELVEGSSLNAPSVNVSSNDAGTFKPYNPNEAIGSTSPSLPYITPPAKQDCNTVASLIRVVVAVVVLVYTQNPYWAAAIAGMGEAAAQTVEINGGQRDGYDVGGIAVSALSAGVGAGSGASEWVKAAEGLKAMGRAATVAAGAAAANYTTSYAINRVAGEDVHFKWSELATASVSAALAAGVLQGVSPRTGATGLATNNLSETPAFSWGAVAKEALQSVARQAIRAGVATQFMGNSGWNWEGVLGNVAQDVAVVGLGGYLTDQRRERLRTERVASYVYEAAWNDGNPFGSAAIGPDAVDAYVSLYDPDTALAYLHSEGGRGTPLPDDRFSSLMGRLGGDARVLTSTEINRLLLARASGTGSHLTVGGSSAHPQNIALDEGEIEMLAGLMAKSGIDVSSYTQDPATMLMLVPSGSSIRDIYPMMRSELGTLFNMDDYRAATNGMTFSESGQAIYGGGINLTKTFEAIAARYAYTIASDPMVVAAKEAYDEAPLTLVRPYGAESTLTHKAVAENILRATIDDVQGRLDSQGAIPQRKEFADYFGTVTSTLYSAAFSAMPIGEGIGLALRGAGSAFRGLSARVGSKSVVPDIVMPRMNLADDFSMTPYSNGARRYQIHDPSPDGFGHGLAVNINSRGEMSFSIRSSGNAELGSGSDMFNSFMLRARRDNVGIGTIHGEWHIGTDSVNASKYIDGINAGMTPQQAALSTWTGRMATKHGYTDVYVPEVRSGVVRPVFTKPVQVKP